MSDNSFMGPRGYAAIYGDFKDGKQVHYVRLCPIETPTFPHGVSVGAFNFPTREEALVYRGHIEDYVHEVVKSQKEDLIDALRDLVREVRKIDGILLPDSFDYNAVHNAEIALGQENQ